MEMDLQSDSGVKPIVTFDFYAIFDFRRFADGYQFFCTDCNTPAMSTQLWYPCINEFVTNKIRCLTCNKIWRAKGEIKSNARTYSKVH